MNKALHHKSIGDLGKYHTTTNSLIISLFKKDRKQLLEEKERLQNNIDRGGTHKEEATDQLYMLCVDLLQTKYLSKQIQKKEIRKENDSTVEEIEE